MRGCGDRDKLNSLGALLSHRSRVWPRASACTSSARIGVSSVDGHACDQPTERDRVLRLRLGIIEQFLLLGQRMQHLDGLRPDNQPGDLGNRRRQGKSTCHPHDDGHSDSLTARQSGSACARLARAVTVAAKRLIVGRLAHDDDGTETSLDVELMLEFDAAAAWQLRIVITYKDVCELTWLRSPLKRGRSPLISANGCDQSQKELAYEVA